jgi:hypothetical protein
MPRVVEPLQKEGKIIPFRQLKDDKSHTKTSTIAALVAVTIMHDSSLSAEDKLLEIIENSGEAEVLNNDDAFSELGLCHSDEPSDKLTPVNDNSHPVHLI